jgi:hypothetical protein
MPLFAVPLPVAAEGFEFAVGADDAATQVAGVIGQEARDIGVGGAHDEGGQVERRHLRLHRGRDERVARLDGVVGETAVRVAVGGGVGKGPLQNREHLNVVGHIIADAAVDRLADQAGVEIEAVIDTRSLPIAAQLDVVGADQAVVEHGGNAARAEGDALQRTRGDQAAGGAVGQADLTANQVTGQAIGCVPGRVLDDRGAVGVPRAVVAANAVVVGDFAERQDVAAAAAERRTGRKRHGVGTVVAISGHAAFDFTLHAGELMVEHEVHDTRQGVRAIGRRGAAGDDVDAADEAVRERIDVGRAVGAVDRGVDDALAVEQDQGTARTQTAQVELVDARGAAREVTGEGTRRHAVGERRQGVHGVGDVGVRHGVELFGAENGDRGRGFVAVAHNARTGHDDFFNTCGLRILRGRGLGMGQLRAGEGTRHQGDSRSRSKSARFNQTHSRLRHIHELPFKEKYSPRSWLPERGRVF